VSLERRPGAIKNHISAVDFFGHGTEIEITWLSPKTKRTEWHKGKVVAIDEEKGIAIRYGKGAEASIAWHTNGDIEARGFVVTTARRYGEHTNQTYQELGTNMILGCLLLTDEGECECNACKVNWPKEVADAGNNGIDVAGVPEMGPAEGRKELNSREK